LTGGNGARRRLAASLASAPIANRQSAIHNPLAAGGRRRGIALLEVVLAMAIFFAAALVILAGLGASVRGVQRVQLEAQAQDLAVSLLSEVQMGLLPLTSDGPTDYEEDDLRGWSWEIVVEPYQEPQPGLELPEFQSVQVIIRHESGCVTKLTTLMTEEPAETELEEPQP
jgi:type II secretion system protein I